LAFAFLGRQNIDYDMISPSDIFLDKEGVVKILDPDLASGTFNGGFSIRSTNYFSPESLQGRYNPDKSCIFSLGICMLETMLM
jgi:serine/threonine protein kinase